MKRVFNKDYLVDELRLPYYNTDIIVEDNIIDALRWSIVHELIFEENGKFYRTTYSEGATEMQSEKPWQYKDEIECEEVVLKEVKIKKWVTAE
jgi:hypothetical protein